MAFKGFQLVAAIITVSELGEHPSFEHPRQLHGLPGVFVALLQKLPRTRFQARSLLSARMTASTSVSWMYWLQSLARSLSSRLVRNR
jgi:hypothetical protein